MQDKKENYKTNENYNQLSNKQELKKNLDNLNNNNLLLYEEELSQIIHYFDKMNIKEIEPTTNNIKENIFEEDLNIIIDELVNFIFKEVNEGKGEKAKRRNVLNYINNYKTNSQEIYSWLLNNQNSSSSIYLLGYFNYYEIETNLNRQKAFELYKMIELESNIAKYELANMYIDGEGIDKNYEKAFELSKALAKKEYSSGINLLGYCYEKGIGTDANEQKAFESYQKAADLGNSQGINNLGWCYDSGIGTNSNKKKAFELYQIAANLGNSYGLNNLGCFHDGGIETVVNKQKAFGLFKEASSLGNELAQYNLALMYESGDGTKKNVDQAIYWYKKSADHGCQDAQNKLKEFLKD
ncbi:uncharacterized protein OCT59_023441 [Rhizophagus irregularis]|nr:hypothetical protein OCT59_023441 [Rhizophagus irregularis]